VWVVTAAVLLAGAAFWRPQPAHASAGHNAAVRLAVGPAVQRHLMALYAAYRHIPVISIAAESAQVLAARQRYGTTWAMVRWQPSPRPCRYAAAQPEPAQTPPRC